MSMDRSLKTGGGLVRHRNVLSRAERIAKLRQQERWADEGSVFGLPKVAHRNVKVGKKIKKKEEAAIEAGAPGAPATAPAASDAAAKKEAPGKKEAAGKKETAGKKEAAGKGKRESVGKREAGKKEGSGKK